MNEEYATFIARKWNTSDEASGFVGYVRRFLVKSEYLAKNIIGSVEAISTHTGKIT